MDIFKLSVATLANKSLLSVSSYSLRRHFFIWRYIMKKKLLALFAMLFVCTMLSFGLTACKNDNTSESTASDTAPAHEHTYNQQVVEEKYLKSAATCTAKAVYYCSCLCGAIGTTTFEYGETTAHPAESEWSYNETHHWHNSTCACNVKVDYAEHTTDGSGWCSVCQQAVLPTDGVLYDVSADGTYAEVVAYIGEYSKVKISDTYNNLPVRNIYNGAFKNATITNVFIPDSVTSIGWATFEGCTSLKSVTIPDSVTSIASSAFSGCSNLQYNVYSYIKYLGNANNPYYALITTINSNLSSYQIHNETKLICDSAFIYCKRLKNITIPSSVTSIGASAFSNCSGLTNITIPDSVTSIGASAINSERDFRKTQQKIPNKIENSLQMIA